MMLEDVGLSSNLLKIFIQHRATLLAQQCCTMLASFEQAFKLSNFDGKICTIIIIIFRVYIGQNTYICI